MKRRKKIDVSPLPERPVDVTRDLCRVIGGDKKSDPIVQTLTIDMEKLTRA